MYKRQGLVHLVNGSWIPDWLNEVCDFPAGSFDDVIDSVSGAVQMLAKTGGPYAVLI